MSDALWIEDVTDIRYLTGVALSRGLVLRTGRESALFVDGRYIASARAHARCPTFLWERETPWQWLRERGVKTLGFDSAKTTVDQLEALKRQAAGFELVGISAPLKKERSLKRPDELALLRRAARLTLEGIEHIRGKLREGITELDIAWEFEVFVRTHGASGLSFEPIIAFGENSAYPHHRAGATKLRRDQLVLMDVGAIVEGYRGDFTRMHRFGQIAPELEHMITLVEDAKTAAEMLIRPGQLVETLDRAARQVFASQDVEALFVHGLGHGVGLETHECPSLKATGPDAKVPLEPGMVITIEPGLYREGFGGVRIEDMVVVTEHGAEKLA